MALDVPDTKYLFQRSGSQNWYLRLVYPADASKSRKVIERSLGVINKDQAWQAAADSINLKVDAAEARIRDAVDSARAETEAVAADATREMVSRLSGIAVDPKDAAAAVKAEFNV